jgi:hypothetical protein
MHFISKCSPFSKHDGGVDFGKGFFGCFFQRGFVWLVRYRLEGFIGSLVFASTFRILGFQSAQKEGQNFPKTLDYYLQLSDDHFECIFSVNYYPLALPHLF